MGTPSLTRRDFMSVAVGAVFTSEYRRYADPATELEVVRLTNPAFASGLTATHLRQFTRRADSLVYWSERDGTRQVYRLDLKTGESRQLTSAAALDVSSFSLSPDDRYLYYFDGGVLQSVTAALPKPRDVYRAPPGSVRTGFSVASDGSVLFVEDSRILRIALQKTGPVFDSPGKIEMLMARPRHGQIVYRQAGALWLLNTDGTGRKQLALAAGVTGESLWSPTGRTLLYLHLPDDPKQLITLRECNPEDSTDQLIARTSQFESFAPNADASVFAGASRSKASSYILILLRVAKRELTLCEHRASDPSLVSIVFSPDSQSIVFVSDRHGKPALYRVPVEKFVEETSDQ
jgi:oligogalacturonide lyase